MKFIITIAVLMLAFLWPLGYFFGKNDTISIIGVGLTSILLFIIIHKVHISSRELLRLYVDPKSWLYIFLSGKSFFTIITAFAISLITSIILITILKGMLISYGDFKTLLIILTSSLIIYKTSEFFYFGQRNLNNHLKEELSTFINTIVMLITLVLLFNLIISVFITFLEIDSFIKSNVSLNNFEEYAIANSVEKNNNNFYGRIIINLYLFIDNLKIATTNTFFSNFLNIDKSDYFWTLFFTTFLFNFIKLFGFSFAFVYLQISFSELITMIQTKFNKKEVSENM